MDITVIGTGYVGLVTGLCFAQMGHFVTCLDIDEAKIKQLQEGHSPIYEPGLNEILIQNLKSKRVIFTTSYKQAIEKAQICFLALPTEMSEDGSADLSYLKQAAATIGKLMNHPLVIVNKSTAPMGTVETVRCIIGSELEKRDIAISFDVASNPEFLKEGSAVQDCMKPDRIILGSNNQQTIELMKKLYKGFLMNHDRFIVMDPTSAEMTKYAANVMLASRISLMNEFANLCEEVGANINQVRLGIGSDKRIGYEFLYAGTGFGGSCFPKDIEALKVIGRNLGMPMEMTHAIASINEKQKTILFDKLYHYFSTQLKGKTIAIWGLSFKPETDDIRKAPSLEVIKALVAHEANIHLYDPIAMDNVKKIFPPGKYITYFTDEYSCANGCDAIMLMTEWKQFRFVNHQKLLSNMRGRAFFDGRNQYDPTEMKMQGFEYYGIGVTNENAYGTAAAKHYQYN